MERVKLVVLICEEALSPLLEPELLALGAKGYTISEVRGRGNRGERDARWALSGNIRVEVLCSPATAERILTTVDARFGANFGLVAYAFDVEAPRAGKY